MGGSGEQTWFNRWFGFDMDNTIGFQVRHDAIMDLTLNHTERRRTIEAITRADVDETALSFYFTNKSHWLQKFRTVAGLRSDTYFFDVSDRLYSQNSGSETASIVSPKLSLIFGPWQDTEFFVNLGYGFHSNDARGVTRESTRPIPHVPRAECRRWRGNEAPKAASNSIRARSQQHAGSLVAGIRFGTGVRRGCRHHRAYRQKRALRRRMDQLLQASTG